MRKYDMDHFVSYHLLTNSIPTAFSSKKTCKFATPNLNHRNDTRGREP